MILMMATTKYGCRLDSTRGQLDSLGYYQPLVPICIPLVEALLYDLKNKNQPENLKSKKSSTNRPTFNTCTDSKKPGDASSKRKPLTTAIKQSPFLERSNPLAIGPVGRSEDTAKLLISRQTTRHGEFLPCGRKNSNEALVNDDSVGDKKNVCHDNEGSQQLCVSMIGEMKECVESTHNRHIWMHSVCLQGQIRGLLSVLNAAEVQLDCDQQMSSIIFALKENVFRIEDIAKSIDQKFGLVLQQNRKLQRRLMETSLLLKGKGICCHLDKKIKKKQKVILRMEKQRRVYKEKVGFLLDNLKSFEKQNYIKEKPTTGNKILTQKNNVAVLPDRCDLSPDALSSMPLSNKSRIYTASEYCYQPMEKNAQLTNKWLKQAEADETELKLKMEVVQKENTLNLKQLESNYENFKRKIECIENELRMKESTIEELKSDKDELFKQKNEVQIKFNKMKCYLDELTSSDQLSAAFNVQLKQFENERDEVQVALGMSKSEINTLKETLAFERKISIEGRMEIIRLNSHLKKVEANCKEKAEEVNHLRIRVQRYIEEVQRTEAAILYGEDINSQLLMQYKGLADEMETLETRLRLVEAEKSDLEAQLMLQPLNSEQL